MDEGNDSLLKSKKVVFGAAGSGLVAIVTFFLQHVAGEARNLEEQIERRHTEVVAYVDKRHDEVQKMLQRIESLLVKIDDRIYELNKTKKGE